MYSRDLTSFMTSFNSSFENINVVMLDPKIFFLIDACVTNAAAVNPNGIKTFISDGVTMFLINGKLAGINRLRKLRNLPS